MSERSKRKQKFSVYVVECCDGTLYTGFTTDIERRIDEHNTSPKGAKYTKARRPVVLRYTEEFNTQSKAQVREAEIKKLSRAEKLVLIRK